MRTKILIKIGILIIFVAEMVKRVHRVLAALLVALFATYYCETTLFVHTHTFFWGTVTHSHPYWPSANHGHDQSECQAISLLSIILITSIGPGIITMCYRRVISVLRQRPTGHEALGIHVCNALRGPPFSF